MYMRISSKPWFSVFLQKLITLAMIIGVVIILLLPLVVYLLLKYYEKSYSNYFFIARLCFLYPSGFLGFLILYNAREILKKVNSSNPFVYENAIRIKYIACYSGVLCIIHAVAALFIHSFFIPILFVVFGLTALFLAVLGELFNKSVKYKEENDFTI